MTFDDWNNIVTSNAYWINLVLVMIILVVFYRHYREIHIRYEEVIPFLLKNIIPLSNL